MRQVRSGSLQLEYYIYSDNYYLTLFDLWTIANYYKLPLLFISAARFKVNNKKELPVNFNFKTKLLYYTLLQTKI